MQETLYLQRTLISEVKTLWAAIEHASAHHGALPCMQVKTLWAAIEQPDLNLKGWKARGPARVMLLAGWLLCRWSPIDVSIDLQQAHLTPDDGVKLAKLMRDMPKLVTIDVRARWPPQAPPPPPPAPPPDSLSAAAARLLAA